MIGFGFVSDWEGKMKISPLLMHVATVLAERGIPDDEVLSVAYYQSSLTCSVHISSLEMLPVGVFNYEHHEAYRGKVAVEVIDKEGVRWFTLATPAEISDHLKAIVEYRPSHG